MRGRQTFIDGLRGIAAFVVAVGHMWGMVPPDHPQFSLLDADMEHLILWPWLFGKQMVWLFILLSGFALYWSEEHRSWAGRPPTPLRAYFGRRVWRILPTYYLSLGLGALVTLGLGALLVAPAVSLRTYGPVTLGGVVSHLFLVHNLESEWMFQLNPPLWSIAVEAQLYILFPVMMALSRRLSPYLAAAGLTVSVLLANRLVDVPLFSLAHWFLVGTLLAYVARRWTSRPRAALATVAAVTISVGCFRLPALSGVRLELLWLVAFSALILTMQGAREGGWNFATWRSITWMGDRSYSLYAVHFPIALVVWALVGRLPLPRTGAVALTLFIGVPTAVVAAHGFYKLVEEPSLRRVKAIGRRTA